MGEPASVFTPEPIAVSADAAVANKSISSEEGLDATMLIKLVAGYASTQDSSSVLVELCRLGFVRDRSHAPKRL